MKTHTPTKLQIKELPLKKLLTLGASALLLSSIALQAEPTKENQPTVFLPPLQKSGEWKTVEKQKNQQQLLETKIWQGTKKTTQNGTPIHIRFQPYNPTPPLEEIIRSFEKAQKRKSYAIDIQQIQPPAPHNTPNSTNTALILYTNPQEKTQGLYKIFTTPTGVLTLETKTQTPTKKIWKKILQTFQNSELR